MVGWSGTVIPYKSLDIERLVSRAYMSHNSSVVVEAPVLCVLFRTVVQDCLLKAEGPKPNRFRNDRNASTLVTAFFLLRPRGLDDLGWVYANSLQEDLILGDCYLADCNVSEGTYAHFNILLKSSPCGEKNSRLFSTEPLLCNELSARVHTSFEKLSILAWLAPVMQSKRYDEWIL